MYLKQEYALVLIESPILRGQLAKKLHCHPKTVMRALEKNTEKKVTRLMTKAAKNFLSDVFGVDANELYDFLPKSSQIVDNQHNINYGQKDN